MSCATACCTSEHDGGAPCDRCPFEAAGREGQLLQSLFYKAARFHPKDPKSPGIGTWHAESVDIQYAFDLFRITDKLRADQLLHRAMAILNGDAEPPPLVYED